jgi:hypothetical protein
VPVLNSPAGAILRWDGFMDVRSWNVLHVSSPSMIGEGRAGVVGVASVNDRRDVAGCNGGSKRHVELWIVVSPITYARAQPVMMMKNWNVLSTSTSSPA